MSFRRKNDIFDLNKSYLKIKNRSDQNCQRFEKEPVITRMDKVLNMMSKSNAVYEMRVRNAKRRLAAARSAEEAGAASAHPIGASADTGGGSGNNLPSPYAGQSHTVATQTSRPCSSIGSSIYSAKTVELPRSTRKNTVATQTSRPSSSIGSSIYSAETVELPRSTRKNVAATSKQHLTLCPKSVSYLNSSKNYSVSAKTSRNSSGCQSLEIDFKPLPPTFSQRYG